MLFYTLYFCAGILKNTVFTRMQPEIYMKIFKSNRKLIVFTSLLSYNMTIAGTSQIPRSKLQGIKLSRHSSNGCAYTSA